jgi:Cu/Ag efflux protein CusF
MRLWKALLLIDLALLLGVGWGYVFWGRRVSTLARELDVARAQVGQLERELAAMRSGRGGTPGEQQWQVSGVIRAVLPSGVLVITHEEIPGYMPSMTMGFRTVSPEIPGTVHVGDTVRFTLRGAPPNVVITAIEKIG